MAYYYFDFNDRAKQNVDNCPRSVIVQLCRGAEKLPDSVQKLYDQFGRHQMEPSLGDLFEALLSVIPGRDPCFIILDALDEFEREDESERKDVLAMLSQIVSRGLKNLHILVTSRKESDIESILAPIVTGKLSLSQDSTEVDADIGVWVYHCLVTDFKLKRWSDSVKKEIETSLIDGAHGMYVESSSPSWYIDLNLL